MFILHLDLIVKPDSAEAFKATYNDIFVPAIAQQPGFVETKLLLARSPEARTHRLVIAFETEAHQQQWVASPLHQAVAVKLESNIARVRAADSFDKA